MLPMSPSRNAGKRLNAHGRRRRGKKENDCVAVNAGFNAAIEEVQAEEREIRKAQAEEEFHTKIKNAVHRRL